MSDKETETYGVLSPVRRDNKRYDIGSPIELDEDGHAELSKLGCVTEDPITVDDADQAAPQGGQTQSPDELTHDTLEGVIAGIQSMTPEDFKKDGDPRADALDRVFAERPGVELIEQAMTAIKEEAAS